jgi:hypothetical protein
MPSTNADATKPISSGREIKWTKPEAAVIARRKGKQTQCKLQAAAINIAMRSTRCDGVLVIGQTEDSRWVATEPDRIQIIPDFSAISEY